MSDNRWIARFEQHSVHSTLNGLRLAIDTVSQTAPPDVREILQRLRDCFAYVAVELASCDAKLVPEGTLNQINKQANITLSAVNGYVPGGAIEPLIGANSHAEVAITHARSLPIVDRPDHGEAMIRLFTVFRDEVASRSTEVRVLARDASSQLERLRADMSSMMADISAQKGRLDNAIAQFLTQASTAEAERTRQFGEAEAKRLDQASANEEQRRQIDAAASEQRKVAFEESLKRVELGFVELSARFDAEEDDREKQFKGALGDITKGFEALNKDAHEKSAALLSAIESEKSKAEKLVHVIGNTGMVGGYQRIANAERLAMWIWQGVTFAAMLGLIIVALLILPWATKEFSWGGLVGRLFVATSFGVFAAYGGSQAAHHRAIERRNRRMELELASIDPYLALLPEAERHTIKKTLAEKMFGQPDGFADEKAPTNVLALAKTGLETAKELATHLPKK